jgi:hypothetical protein
MTVGTPDGHGRKPDDPTTNVLDLVRAAMQRQDDLRNLVTAHGGEMLALVERHAGRMADLRADYDSKLREAESARIDAIRSVDVGAVQRAAEVQQDQANTLAGQVATTADAFRASLTAALVPIQNSIDDLRRAQYEAQGQKTQVVETRDTGADVRATAAVAAAEAQAKAMQLRATLTIVIAAAGAVIAFLAYAFKK